jgi:hypothetical protein
MTYSTWGMNYSTIFRELAEDAAQRAVLDLDNPNLGKHAAPDGARMTYTPRAAEAVILSVAALEAGINEIAVMTRRGFLASPSPLPDDFMAKNVTDKWALVPRVAAGKEFDYGASPWQDFSALVGLRNALVHFKWESESVPKFVRSLQARALVLPDKPGIYWVDAALTDRVARWAIETTDSMFAEVTRLLARGDDPTWAWC